MNMSGSSSDNGTTVVRRLNEEVLSVSRGLVVRVDQEVQIGEELHTEVFIEKRFPLDLTGYTKLDQQRFLRELFVFNQLKEVSVDLQIPKLLGSASGKTTPDGTIRFSLEFCLGSAMIDVYSGMSKDAVMLERELISGQEFPNLACYNSKAVNELHKFGRLEQTVKGLRLKPSIRALYEAKDDLVENAYEKHTDFLRIFRMGLKFQEVATKLLDKTSRRFRYGQKGHIADISNALDSLNLSRSAPCPQEDLKEALQLFKEIYLPIILETPEVMIHGDFTPFNVLIDRKKQDDRRYTLLDMGQVSAGSPFFDVANYVTFCNLFCGMEDANPLWNSAFEKYGEGKPGLRTIVQNTRDLEVLGILSTRMRATNMFTPEDILGMAFRRSCYRNVLEQGLEQVYPIPGIDKERVKRFNELIKKICEY